MRALGVALALCACKKAEPVAEAPPPARDAGRATDARGPIEKQMVLELVIGALPPGVSARGQSVVKQVAFRDRAGTHYVVFSQTEVPRGKQLFVDAWLVAPGVGPRGRDVVTDGIAGCGDQLTVAFHDAALDLTDLDHDGLAELTFGYEAGCRREPHGNPYKVVTLAGALYTMTGHTRLDHGTPPMGDFTPDAALAAAPELLEHARGVWDQSADDLDSPPKLDDSDDSTPAP